MLRHNFRRLDKDAFLLLYKTYVHPHLENCVEVLNREQTNLVPHLRKYSYEDRLKRLGIPSLDQRKSRGDIIDTYKILTGKENIESEQFFTISLNLYSLRGHNLNIQKHQSRLDM